MGKNEKRQQNQHCMALSMCVYFGKKDENVQIDENSLGVYWVGSFCNAQFTGLLKRSRPLALHVY